MSEALVEVLRGGRVESVHRGSAVVRDAGGGVVLRIGDTAEPVFPRSAVKAIQALPLVESGTADALGFGAHELALACASHAGEPAHTALAQRMLSRAGLDVDDLECGTHWPRERVARAMAAAGERPSALHNNCSGKHTGFLCTCVRAGDATGSYVDAAHPAQERVREALEAVTGAAHGSDNRGTDGCSIPIYAVPLDALALGFARMATGVGLGPARAKAARRLLEACMAEPFLTAGSGAPDTRFMEAGAGAVFTKTGAEGVYCAALPGLGLGVAVKCDDGASRAAEVVTAALLARLVGADGAGREVFEAMARPVLRNWNGLEVGRLQPAEALAALA